MAPIANRRPLAEVGAALSPNLEPDAMTIRSRTADPAASGAGLAPAAVCGATTAVLAVALIALLGAPSAFAHGVLTPGTNPLWAWNLTADITGLTLLAAAVYGAGLWRRRHKRDASRPWRALSFYGGLTAIFLALQSPIDPIAERIFLVHQVQHLLLRMIGPMLIFLAAPQALLVAGLPAWAQRNVLAPLITNRFLAGLFGLLAHPVVVTMLFIGTLYFWQIPTFQDMALLNDAVHYLMHVSLLVPGLLFFWRVFDFRPAPVATGYGVRLMMLWVMILSNIVIGSYLAFKQPVLYSAYGELGRIWGFSASSDELLGGALIWIPSSMMGVVAVLIVIHKWARQEDRDARGAAARPGGGGLPTTGAELIAQASAKNRTMALGFGVFAGAVFATVITIGMIALSLAR